MSGYGNLICGVTMAEQGNSHSSDILPVIRSKEEARQLYNRISRLYDCLAGTFEHKYRQMALENLAIQAGETVLEIGFGTGHCLRKIAQAVGSSGRVYGVDISPAMLEVAEKRLKKAVLMDRVELYCGDAAELPYDNETFDAVFMSFTLELFDTPEIPKVLEQIKRVLRPGGRLGVVSMSKDNGESIILKLYEWTHS